MSARRVFFAVVAATLLTGCPKQEEVIVETADGKELTAEDIDKDPLALLPGGFVGFAYVDAQQFFGSQFAPQATALAQRVVPVPASAGFEPKRDLQRVYVGAYSMQGADVAGVATGTFDPEKISKAADGTQTNPMGFPVVQSQYAGRTLYTSQDVGFVVLTKHTVLFGNETAMRRTLDRIKEGRVRRELPQWMGDLLETEGAPFAGGIDLRAQPTTEALAQSLPFLDGLQTVRVVGNFKPPGVNMAGTASYGDAAAAQRGADNLKTAQQQLQSFAPLMSLIGIPQPLHKLEAQAKDDEAQFVAELDGQAITSLLSQLANLVGASAGGDPVPATLTPGVGQPQ